MNNNQTDPSQDAIRSFVRNARTVDDDHTLSNFRYTPEINFDNPDVDLVVVTDKDDKIQALAQVSRADWDSPILGMPCGRIHRVFASRELEDRPSVYSRLVRFIYGRAEERGLRFLSWRFDAEEVLLAQTCEAAGFRLCDVMVGYRLHLAPDEESKQVTRPQSIDDASLSRCLSGMRYGRMFQDPEIPDDIAHKFYVDLSRQYLDQGAHLSVVHSNETIVGFAIGILDDEVTRRIGKSYGHLWLIGVDPAHAGQGFGRHCFETFCAEFSSACSIVDIGTQVYHTGANKIYTDAAADVVGHSLTYHWHASVEPD